MEDTGLLGSEGCWETNKLSTFQNRCEFYFFNKYVIISSAERRVNERDQNVGQEA